MDRILRAALALLLVGFGEVSAQTPTLPTTTLPTGTPIQIPSAARQIPRVAPDAITLEGAVDPQEYVVGPGDVFSVTIGGSIPRQVTATVSADGRLAIPEAGSFEAAGRTLASVLAQTRPALQRRFANVPTDVTLAQPRQFFVHVSGAVLDPGRHVVRAVGRVEDALISASLDATLGTLLQYGLPAGEERLRPAYRNVRVEREDGTVLTVDIARYVATGSPRYNPYLRDGDRVQLPVFAPRREGVFVSGAVLRPGIYDIRTGDTVADLAEVAGAPEGAVFRYVSGGTERSVTTAEAPSVSIRARDQIVVAEADPLAGAAQTEGAVAFPGLYPVRSGETTVGDLLSLSGGLAADALPRAAYLERPTATPDSAEIADLRSDGLELLDQLYYRQEIARTPRFGLDLDASASRSIVVRDGDRLVVPRGGDGVRVFGAVGRPGFVPFTPGQSASAYVEAAGGLAESATNVYVVEAGTGRLLQSTDQPLELGDAVFASRDALINDPQTAQVALQRENIALQINREIREIEREERQARFQLVQTAAIVLQGLATAVSLYFAITNN